MLGLALIGLIAFLVGHVGLTSRHTVDQAAAAPPASIVRLRWRADELRPAPSGGHICVTDATYGRICSTFAAGERPADSLKREVARRGLRLQASLAAR